MVPKGSLRESPDSSPVVPAPRRYLVRRERPEGVRLFVEADDGSREELSAPSDCFSPLGMDAGSVDVGTGGPGRSTLALSRAILGDLFRRRTDGSLAVSFHARRFAEKFLVPMRLAVGEESGLLAADVDRWAFEEVARDDH